MSLLQATSDISDDVHVQTTGDAEWSYSLFGLRLELAPEW